MTECNVPGCWLTARRRGLCYTHLDHIRHHRSGWQQNVLPYRLDAQTGPQLVERWVCECADARRDDWECPTCRRPSYSPERIAELQQEKVA